MPGRHAGRGGGQRARARVCRGWNAAFGSARGRHGREGGAFFRRVDARRQRTDGGRSRAGRGRYGDGALQGSIYGGSAQRKRPRRRLRCFKRALPRLGGERRAARSACLCALHVREGALFFGAAHPQGGGKQLYLYIFEGAALPPFRGKRPRGQHGGRRDAGACFPLSGHRSAPRMHV